MAELAVTAFGADRPGIVAAVARVLHDHGGNVEDSAMTILGGHFAIVLLVEVDAEPQDLRRRLAEATDRFGLTVAVTRAGPGRTSPDPTHLLSVYGADQPGILAGVTQVLADHGANITDLETRLLGGDEPVYAMVLELVLDVAAETAVRDAVARACDELGIDHTLRALETETY